MGSHSQHRPATSAKARIYGMSSSKGPKKAEIKDGYRLLADTMREKKGVDYANAKLEGPDGDGEIIEFVRGKDLARYLRAHPEKMDGLVQPIRPGENPLSGSELKKPMLLLWTPSTPCRLTLAMHLHVMRRADH